MSAGNKERLPEVSDLQRRLDAIAQLEELEMEYIHVHSLANEIDPTPDKILAGEITHIHDEKTYGEKTDEPTFAQQNGIITRRRSRKIASRLLERR